MRNNFAIAGALCMIIAGALVAHAVSAPGAAKLVAHSAVSPFEMMLKAKDLPVESYETV